MHKVLIGIVSYNDLPYLRASLPAIEELRKRLPADVVVMDNAQNDELRDFLEEEYENFDYLRYEDANGEVNLGYGRSYNEMLKRFPGYEYFLVHTSDVLLDPVVVRKFLKRMERDKDIALCAGKLYHWDFDLDRRMNFIDSFGIVAEKRHHFYDLGHGEKDEGQYDHELNRVFGVSGAVFLIRTEVIPKLHGHDWQLYDERMWMYKEDIDLSYRLRWLGEKIRVFPEVWGWHARTIANKEGHRLEELVKADRVKRGYGRLHSYRNHFLMLKNNFTFKYGLRVYFRVFFYEFMKAVYMFFTHPVVFFSGLNTLLFISGRRSVRRVSPKEMLKFFR